ncbi:hypothetical protein Q8F55_002466 [Vanrija albida]|uniref:NAD(P)-binding domain-containing protein n=1 Tax=Vanrija albida TaxID=181172 RepID=A0ABR3Q9V1_9TREE
MKVLVLGATGFIGLPVALTLSRAGHVVYGTTRDAKAARKLLAQNEIHPLLVTLATERGDSVWGKIAAEVDVVIDTIRSFDAEGPLKSFRLVESLATRGGPAQKITYIYTGSVAEDAPWRWDVEREILSSDKVNGIVIRPGVLYGRSGATLEPFLLAPAYDAGRAGAEFETIGFAETRLSLIHQDDLADLFLRVAERGPLLKGQAFTASNAQSERWADILDAVVRVSGAKGYRLRAPSPDMPVEQTFATAANLRPSLALSLTGWTPRKPGLVDGIDSYWAAFAAHYEGRKTIAAWELPGVTRPRT